MFGHTVRRLYAKDPGAIEINRKGNANDGGMLPDGGYHIPHSRP